MTHCINHGLCVVEGIFGNEFIAQILCQLSECLGNESVVCSETLLRTIVSENQRSKHASTALLCLLAGVRNTSNYDEVFKLLLDLCEKKYFSKQELYASLIARPELNTLNAFLHYERPFLRNSVDICQVLSSKQGNIFMELFLITVSKQQHWLLLLLDQLIHHTREGNVEQVLSLFSHSVFQFLWPLMFLEVLKYNSDIDISSLKLYTEHVIKREECHPSIIGLARQAQWYFTVLLWLKENVTSSCVTSAFDGQMHSTLDLLGRFCSLSDLAWCPTHNFLEEHSGDEGQVTRGEIDLFDAFCACAAALDYILTKINSRHLRLEAENLGNLKTIISQLKSYSLRLKVMENIFSLLFLRYEDFQEEICSDSEEGEIDVNPSLQNDEQMTDLSCNVSSSLTSINNTTKPGFVKILKPAGNQNAKCFVETRNEFEPYRQKHGFVCDQLMTRTLLKLLQSCLNDSSDLKCDRSLENDTLNPDYDFVHEENSVEERWSSLKSKVEDALWRLEILQGSDFVHDPCVKDITCEKNFLPDWLFQNCVDDDSASDDESSTLTTLNRVVRGPDPEKSSESGSQSNLTNQVYGHNSKWSRKSRRKSSIHTCIKSTKDTIIKRMLSSKHNLVVQCLNRGNFSAAKHVVQALELEDSHIGLEVSFVEAFQNIKQKVNTCAVEKSKQLKNIQQPVSQNSTLQAIQRAASDGVQASSLNKEVENLLSNRSLPRVTDVEHITKDFMQLFGGSSEIQPTVTAAVDIVLTASSSLLQAANFWNILTKFSCELQNVQAASSASKSRAMGFFPVVQNILQAPVSASECTSPSQLLHRWDIPNFVTRELRDTLQFWNTIIKLVQEFQTSSDKACFFPKFLQLIASRGLDNKQGHQYLQDFKSYLKSLSAITNVVEEFSVVLHRSPLKCIASTVLDRSFQPHSIEDAVSQLGCHLPHILSSELCSFLPSTPSAVPYVQPVPTAYHGGLLILNAVNTVGPVRHPVILAEVLLSSVCHELSRQLLVKQKLQMSETGYLLPNEIATEKIQSILSATWELRDLDLNLLQPGAETLAFYCNLANLMWIHWLAHLSSTATENSELLTSLAGVCSFQQLVALNSCAYQVGTAGILTLWEVRRLALGDSLMTPIGTRALQDYTFVTDSFDPLVLFVVSTGTPISPKVKVLYPDNLEEQLQQSVKDYVQHWVQPKKVIIPSLVHQYIKSTGQNLKVFLKDYVGEIQDFEHLEEPNFSHEDLPRVVLEYTNYDSQLSSQSFPKVEDSMSWKANPNLCNSILQYINGHSPLVSFLLQELLKEPSVSDDSCESADEALEATETSITSNSYSQNFHQYPCLDRVCRQLSNSSLCQIFDYNTLLCALHGMVPHKLLWKSLNSLATQQKWQAIVDVLNALPQVQVQSDPMLTVSLNIALFELIFEYRGTELPCYLYEKINSLFFRAKCVIAESNFWPGNVSLEKLNKIVQTPELRLYPILLSKIENLILSITVYQKVIDTCPLAPWKSWQEVQTNSLKNPTNVLNQIACDGNAELCLSWLELHDIARAHPSLITSTVVALLLNDTKDRFLDVEKIFESMPSRIAAEICYNVIEALRKLSALKFCVKLLSKKYLDELQVHSRNMIDVVSLGIEMLTAVPTSIQSECIELVCNPHLMIEQLIMNIQLEAAEEMLCVVRHKPLSLSSKSPLSIQALDSLLRQYAEKALEFRISHCSTSSQTSEVNELLLSLSSQSDCKESLVPPVVPTKAEWIANEQASVCMNCHSVTFTMFNRRHHCRRCGRVVCAQCSLYKMLVEGYGNLKVRVCSNCWTKTLKRTATSNSDQLIIATSEGNASLPPENMWRLSNLLVFNETVRGEFAFEHAPSVSLCLSILKLHSESAACPNFLIDSCETILSYLQPHGGMPNPEVDYGFVIEMCRSLVIAAKVKCAQWGYTSDEPSCDQRLSKIDLLGLLISHGCAALIPNETSTNGLRRLQTQLLESELWELALEVSTKSGMKRIGVWTSWGKSCLRAGRWKEARDKFVHCFPSRSRINQSVPDSALLMDILQILEGSSHLPDPEVLRKTDATHSLISHPNNSPAIVVLNTLASLKTISQGKIPQAQGMCGALQPHIYEECCYYLQEYGSDLTYLHFLVRHADFRTVVDHTLSHSIDTQMFFESVYMPCLRTGQITQLHSAMTAVDSSLTVWTRYLFGICAALERRNLLHTLYEVQQWSKDHVRAAMTCIRFYHVNAKSYLQLAANINHLMRAQSHLEGALAVVSVSYKSEKDHVPTLNSCSQSSESLWLHLTRKELDHHINTVERQMELTKFLSAYEAEGHNLFEAARWLPHSFAKPLTQGLPTLFGSTADRKLLAGLCLFCGKNVEEGYGIVYRIMEIYDLPAHEIYEAVSIALFQTNRVSEIPQLLDCIRSSGVPDPSVVCDSVLLACVSSAPDQRNAGDIDIIARNISDQAVKIKVLITCGQLKSAYLLAVKCDRLDDVQIILEEAEKLGQDAIKKICLKRLGR